MFARLTLPIALVIAMVYGTFTATQVRALDLPPDGMLLPLPLHPIPGYTPDPKPGPDYPFPCPLPQPKPWPVRPQPGLILHPTIPSPVVAPTATAPAVMPALAFDGTDGGCTKIPGEDKHPTPPTPHHQDQYV